MRLEAQWIVGFVDGEGCFHVSINKDDEMTAGYQVLPEFIVIRHKRDIQVLHALKAFFSCGVIRKNHDSKMVYRIKRLEHLMEHIVPFFEKHLLKTGKLVNFLKFRKILLKMKSGIHLTPEGIDEIRAIKEKMNGSKLRYSPALLETEETN